MVREIVQLEADIYLALEYTDYLKIEAKCLKLLKLCLKHKVYEKLFFCYKNLCKCYFIKNKQYDFEIYRQALEFAVKALEHANNEIESHEIYHLQGLIYKSMYSKSNNTEYRTEAIVLLHKCKDRYEKINAIYEATLIYDTLGHLTKEIKYFDAALKGYEYALKNQDTYGKLFGKIQYEYNICKKRKAEMLLKESNELYEEVLKILESINVPEIKRELEDLISERR